MRMGWYSPSSDSVMRCSAGLSAGRQPIIVIREIPCTAIHSSRHDRPLGREAIAIRSGG